MARFRPISCSIWEDENFLELSSGAQHQFLYMLTVPNRSESGIFKIHRSTMYAKTKTKESDFEELEESTLIDWDEEHRLVWIVNALAPAYFRPNPNIWKSVINDLKTFSSSFLVKSLISRYSNVYKELTKACIKASKGLSGKGKGKGRGSEIRTGEMGRESLSDINLNNTHVENLEKFQKETAGKEKILWDHELLGRYQPINPLLEGTLKALLTRRDGKSPRSKQKQITVLQTLSKYDVDQVTGAARVFFEKDVAGNGRVSWPYDPYFLGMVRKDAGGVNREKEKEEIEAERKKKRRRIEKTPPYFSDKKELEPQSIREVLKKLPEQFQDPLSRFRVEGVKSSSS